MLCTSAAFCRMTMRRLNNRSLVRYAAGAVLLLGLATPALATTAHRARHAAAAKTPATTSTKTASSKTASAKTVAAKSSARTKSSARAQTKEVAVKSVPVRTRTSTTKRHSSRQVASVASADKPTAADYEAAQRVHAWEASQHSGATTDAAVPTSAPAPHKATSADFIRASQPQASNVLPDEAPAPAQAAPAPKPVHALRGPKGVKPAPKPLTPAVAKMLPGASTETTPALADAEASISPMIAPAMVPLIYTKRGRLIMPAALKGSREILLHQNEMADAEGLDRIQDDDDLARKIANKQLVPIPASSLLHVDERLPDNRRYCRPWVAQFLSDMARAHYARFHTALQVNSAVRTVDFQDRLRRTNGNAAPSDGDTASPHLTGFAVDIAKKPLSQTEIAWMRGYLLPLEQQGKIDVEEEFQQACFHMSVYRKYLPSPSTSPKRSQPAGSASDVIATSLR